MEVEWDSGPVKDSSHGYILQKLQSSARSLAVQHQTPFHSKEFWETRPDADKFPVNALLLIDCGLPEDHKN